jgi:hypothetical protein
MIVDPLGHETRVTYDKSSNVLVRRHLEKQPDASYRLLARTEFVYDELNRKVIESHSLFAAPPAVNDPALDFVASGPGTLASTRYFHDRMGRVTAVVDPEGRRRTTV